MRRVVVTGIGAVSPQGLGAPALWDALLRRHSAIAPLTQFDPAAFPSRIAGVVPNFKVADYVPKSYRKATKIMARDIELAVAAADFAVRDAKLATRGILENAPPEKIAGFTPIDPTRIGCNIGAGLINSDINELSTALQQARDPNGEFSIARWGRSEDPNKNSGMDHLTPLWLLKYLPNMLACHVSIIHDAQGPSNTITCGAASAGLALTEACRTIQRGHADVALVGGGESKIHPTWLVRWSMANRLTTSNDNPAAACRPLDERASGTVIAEGVLVLVIEELEHARRRNATIYCEVAGLGAAANGSAGYDLDPTGEPLAAAIQKSLREANTAPADIQLILPPSNGVPAADAADLTGLRAAFTNHLANIPVVPTRGGTGDCAAGSQALDLAIAALAIHYQTIPPATNCDQPLPGLNVPQEAKTSATLNNVLIAASAIGGQHAAVVFRKIT